MISIIIPIYNSEKTLKKCLNSVLNQSMKNIEVLMINDGSTDNSKKICEDFSKLDSRFKFFDNINRGVSYSRNYGIKKSLGEYIQFVDADDYLEKDMTLNLYNNLVKDNSDLVICGYREIVNENKIIYTNTKENLYLSFSEFNSMFSDLYIDKLLNVPWNKLYVKSKIQSFFEETISLGEDLLFNLQYFQNVNSVSIIDKNLYNYVSDTNKESLSTQFDFSNLQKLKLLHEKVEAYLSFNNVSDQNCYMKVNSVFFNGVYEYFKELSFLTNKKMRKKLLMESLNDEVILTIIKGTQLSNVRHNYVKKRILKKQPRRIIRYFYIDEFIKKAIKN